MAKASIVVRGTADGKRVNWCLERAKREGLTGTFWIKSNGKWDGPHKDEWEAKAAKARRVLGIVRSSTERLTLADAIARFLAVKRTEGRDSRSADRWKWELDLFQKVTGKTHVDEITKEDSHKYWRCYQERKREPRTIFNRLQSLSRFLADPICNVAADRRLTAKELPKYDEPAVDFYSPQDLKLLFAACNAEEKLRYQFFRYSGCREKEV